MNKNLKTILKAIGFAVIALLVVNLVYFLIELSNTDIAESWSFAFNHGNFYLNQKPVGLELFSSKANGLMMIVLIAVLIFEFKKGNLKLNSKRNEL